MADAEKHAWILFEWRRLGKQVDDPAAFIQKKTRQIDELKLSNVDRKTLADATAAVLRAEASVRARKEQLPNKLPVNPRGNPALTGAQLKELSSATAYHQACARLERFLFILLDIQERLGFDQETQDCTSDWHARVCKDCENNRLELTKIAKTEKMVDAMPTGRHWTGGWSIGFGAHANVYLYIRYDENGMISHRVVAKDSDYDHPRSAWNHGCFWSTTPRGDPIPNEVKAMFDLRGKQGSEYIVKILNWRISTADRFHRIYAEYLPFGNSWDMLYAHTLVAKKPVPEPFIWHFFECLATAGLLMERGELLQSPISTWQTIVHRDIKLGNVFLDRPSSSKYRRYPTPKLGDFGAAVYLSQDNPRKAEDYDFAGTPDCYPPEQNPDRHGLSLDRTVSSKSNVWAVASTTASMIWRSDGFEGLKYGQGRGFVNEPSFNKKQTETYSDELRKLILDCMRYNPDDRPDFVTVLRRIRGARQRGFDAGLRDEPASSDKWEAHVLAINLDDKENPIAEVHIDDDHDSDGEIGGAAGAELLRKEEKYSSPERTQPKRRKLDEQR